MHSSKYSKSYENPNRSGIYSSGPLSPIREKLIKFIAILVALAIGLSALHAVFTPKDLIYGLMIDAGSTGSRIHTYTFRTSPKGKLDLLYEDFYALKPGLSSYKHDPEKAAQSLIPLLDRAKSKVPIKLHPDTPVVLRATAGLRMIGEEASEKILEKVRTTLKDSGFLFEGDESARILAGNEEAIYSWMTVNYLMEKEADKTVGTLEMGGGSAQVAFVATDGSDAIEGNCSTAGENVAYGGGQLHLYTVSHLDFGLQKARAVALAKWETDEKLKGNPCINKGQQVELKVPFDEAGKTVTMEGVGDFTACKTLLEDTVIKPAMGEACNCNVCTYKGAAQPKPIDEYVAFAFYLERTVALGMQSPMTVKDIKEKANQVCAMSVTEVKSEFPNVPNGLAEDLCLDLTFIVSHLEWGHGIVEESAVKLTVVDKIKDFELGWCVGAMQQTMAELGTQR